jgi:hypothetical protein
MLCPVCGSSFVMNPSGNKRYCSYRCRDAANAVIYHKVHFSADDLRLRERLRVRV